MDHPLGPIHAPVVFEEYGDYECPSSARGEPVIRALRGFFGSRLRFVFRNFPMRELHPHAERAAEAAEAAGGQGKFWEMHGLLITHPGQLLLPDLVEFAWRLGLDAERFEEELTNHAYSSAVETDVREGIVRGVRKTPTFFINGARYEGEVRLEPLRDAIQRALDEELIRKAI